MFAGFAAAIPLAALSSRPDLGAAARRRGWFLTPEELRAAARARRAAGAGSTPAGADRRCARLAPAAAQVPAAACAQAARTIPSAGEDVGLAVTCPAPVTMPGPAVTRRRLEAASGR